MTPNTTTKFLDVTGVHEPSAIQQLPDGRFLLLDPGQLQIAP